MEDFIIDDETLRSLQKDLEDFDPSTIGSEVDEQDIMSAEEWAEEKRKIEATDPLDQEHLVNLEVDKDGKVYFSSVRGTTIHPDKYYRDENKTPRIDFHFKTEDRKRTDATIYLTSSEKYLSEIIDELPYGLIDKQVTGIGATHLELHSKRNSIIVTPTRALALNKHRKEKSLYVGSKEGHRKSTSKAEIKAYLNNPRYRYKKILVVADSIDKVIQAIQENNEDVYRAYFLLVDEIDTLQSDNHFRPVLSRVIDHYFKFKLLRRALLSATVREFTHPKLEVEPLTTIQSNTPLRRNINLLHTNNINSLLAKKIIDILDEHPTDKILIAYNSVLNILQTIKLLPKEWHKDCAILCSEASKEEAGSYLDKLSKENKLPRKINFMTCSYFAGVDMEDRYHLITVSNSDKVYSALPYNKITQIYGRCRIPDGILSDIILYNHKKRPLRNLATYRDILSKKAQKVIDLLKAANTLKESDKDLTDLFDRIHKVIIEKATERLFEQQSFELTRETINNELEISYFNIDALYEKMEAYYKFYSYKEGLYDQLKKDHSVTIVYDESVEIVEPKDSVKEESNQRLLNRLSNYIEELISTSQANALNSDYLDEKINSSKRKEEEFYKRVKAHYRYYDITFLANILCEGSLKNRKYYRNLNNTLSFRALEDTHPFKLQITQAFRKKKKYTSAEIADILGTIVKDQFFKTLPMKTASQSRMMSLFNSCVDTTYTGGKYLVKGYKPKFNNIEIPEPIRRIPKEEPAIGYFEINSNPSESTDTLYVL